MNHNLLREAQLPVAWPYAVEPSPVLLMHSWQLDGMDIPCLTDGTTYQPALIALYALEQWGLYLTRAEEHFAQLFLRQAHWLVQHARLIADIRADSDGSDQEQSALAGWPVPVPGVPAASRRVCLSAQAQGTGLSVLLRAYRLTGDEQFLVLARRVARTFERDILDGGVAAPLGASGIFFEDQAVYPAAHHLGGFLLSLFGLYDYIDVTGDARSAVLLQRSLATLHRLLQEFDTGCWTRVDLLGRAPASSAQLTLHIHLLEGLARLSGCEHCARLALRWRGYQRNGFSRLRARWAGQRLAARRRFARMLFPRTPSSSQLKVCIVVPAFPVTGGIFTFLGKIVQVMGNAWQYEYLTQHIGLHADGYVIRRFGSRHMTPWYFPFVWLYVASAWRKLFWLLRHGAGYDVILAQDGVYSAAAAGLIGRLAGVRVITIDHSDLSLFLPHNNALYRAQRLKEVRAKNWPWPLRQVARYLLALYWPTRALLARVGARCVDHYLIPGMPADGVESVCQRLGIPWSRVTRVANMIEIARHPLLDEQARSAWRASHHLPAHARVIAIVCRLAPEKGLEIALAALDQALARLAGDARDVHVMIVGAGPLRQQLQAEIQRRSLSAVCTFYGEATHDEVVLILGCCDIFLYTSWRGAGYPLAIMEAMASSCAVIASSEPPGNAALLADGRGILVPPGDIEQTAAALVSLLRDPERVREMGRAARAYIEQEHNPWQFRRTFQRAVSWMALDQLLLEQHEGRDD